MEGSGHGSAGAGGGTLSRLLDEAPTSRFHRRAAVISGMGFFTDAYDLFVISTVVVVVGDQWHLSLDQRNLVASAAIFGAFLGAFVFGRMADLVGRKRIYTLVAAVMIVGALLSAFAQDWVWLAASRLVLGLGIGGDYPVSAVLMSEYANRRDRGRLVGLVFSMQALGLVVGPLVGLALLGSGVSHDLMWRLLLGLGAVPAASVVALRARMPESPRFEAQVRGRAGQAAAQLARFSEGAVQAHDVDGAPLTRLPARQLLTGRTLRIVVATASSWFLLDYALYGNTLSLPAILHEVAPTATLAATLGLSLVLFAVFAVPGYVAAFITMDRIGHRRLQWIGFSVMAGAFAVLGLVPGATTTVAPFLGLFGISYFFIEFGPNTTTFVLPSELFPVRQRTTGHGIAAGVGKLGAFVGVFVVPALQGGIGLRGMLLVAAASAALGALITRTLPEPAGRSLEEITGHPAPAGVAAGDDGTGVHLPLPV